MVSELDSLVRASERSGFRTVAGDFVLCSRATHFTFTVPLSTQECK